MLAAEFGDVNQADMPASFRFVGVGDEVVFARAALAAAAPVDVFHRFEPFEVEPRLGFAPAGKLAQLTAAKDGKPQTS